MAKINAIIDSSWTDRLFDISQFLAEKRPVIEPCECGHEMLRFEQTEPPEGSGYLDYCVLSCEGCREPLILFGWDSDGVTAHVSKAVMRT